jgi:hypothetical protein
MVIMLAVLAVAGVVWLARRNRGQIPAPVPDAESGVPASRTQAGRSRLSSAPSGGSTPGAPDRSGA